MGTVPPDYQAFLEAPFVYSDGQYTGLLCESHAEVEATELGLTWHHPLFGVGLESFTETDPTRPDLTIYELPSWDSGESDVPQACEACGVLLHTDFTSDGFMYLADECSDWMLDLYGYSREECRIRATTCLPKN